MNQCSNPDCPICKYGGDSPVEETKTVPLMMGRQKVGEVVLDRLENGDVMVGNAIINDKDMLKVFFPINPLAPNPPFSIGKDV